MSGSFGAVSSSAFGFSSSSSSSSFGGFGSNCAFTEAPKFSGDPLAIFAGKPLVSFSSFAGSGSSTTSATGATGKRTRAEISKESDKDVIEPTASSQIVSEAPVRAALAASSLEASAVNLDDEEEEEEEQQQQDRELRKSMNVKKSKDEREKEKGFVNDGEDEQDDVKESDRKRALRIIATTTVSTIEPIISIADEDDDDEDEANKGDGGKGGDAVEDFDAHNERLLKESAGYSIFASLSSSSAFSSTSDHKQQLNGGFLSSSSTSKHLTKEKEEAKRSSSTAWTLPSTSSSSSSLSSSVLLEANASDQSVICNGEEGEITILEFRARLFTLGKETTSSSSASSSSSSAPSSWRDCGIGIIRLNVRRDLVSLLPSTLRPKSTTTTGEKREGQGEQDLLSGPSARIVMRQESHANSGSGTRLLLNAHIWKSFPVAPHVAAANSITLSAIPVPSSSIESTSQEQPTATTTSEKESSSTFSSSSSSFETPQPYLLRFQKQAQAESMLTAIYAARELDIAGVEKEKEIKQ
jgi:hypothetical protein